MSNKIIVTGGAGFIGTHLVNELKILGNEVKVIDIKLDENLDVRNLEKIAKHFEGIEYVFHLAALPSVPLSIEKPLETHSTNLTGTVNVLIAARDAGVKRLIFPSSAAVYGDQEILPISESAHLNPSSPYALQKLESEMYLKLFCNLYNLETVSLRYFNVYGEGQNFDGPYTSLVTQLVENYKKSKPHVIFGDGEQIRDFINVKDVVAANIAAMTSSQVGKGEAINIASGKGISVNEIVQMIGGESEYHDSRVEIKNSVADISLAKELLKWAPKISIEEEIKKLL